MEYAKSRSRERPWQTNISSKARKVLSTKHVSMINHSTGSSLSKVGSDARLARLIQENDELKPRASIIRTPALYPNGVLLKMLLVIYLYNLIGR